MKVFLTGATGFVGRHTIPLLTSAGHQLRCLVRSTSDTTLLKSVGATLITGDISDKNTLRQGMAGCDCVLHLAGAYSFWEPDTDVFRRVNVQGTRNVMECALESDIARVVYLSSTTIYGKPEVVGPFREETPMGPVRFTTYAQSKYEAEQVVWELYRERSLPVIVLYAGLIIGPGEQGPAGNYIRNLMRRRSPSLLFGNAMFTVVPVEDVATGIVRAAEKPDFISGARYFLGKEAFSWRAFTQLVCDAAGVPAPRLPLPEPLVWPLAALLTWLADRTKRPPFLDLSTECMRHLQAGLWYDGSKAEHELGVTYHPVRDSLEKTVAAYRQQG